MVKINGSCFLRVFGSVVSSFLILISISANEVGNAQYPTSSLGFLTTAIPADPLPELPATLALAAKYTSSLGKELSSKDVTVDRDAQKKINKMLEGGAKEVRSYGATPRLQQEANENIEKFGKELAKNAERSNGQLIVTKKSLTLSLSICPLWPICK